MVTFMLCEFYFNKTKGKGDNTRALPHPLQTPLWSCLRGNELTPQTPPLLPPVLSRLRAWAAQGGPCPAFPGAPGKSHPLPGSAHRLLRPTSWCPQLSAEQSWKPSKILLHCLGAQGKRENCCEKMKNFKMGTQSVQTVGLFIPEQGVLSAQAPSRLLFLAPSLPYKHHNTVPL